MSVKSELESIKKLNSKINSLEMVKEKSSIDIDGINLQISSLKSRRDKIIDKILNLDGEMCSFFLYRYVNDMTIEEIAEIMNCSLSTVYRIQKKGIEILQSR